MISITIQSVLAPRPLLLLVLLSLQFVSSFHITTTATTTTTTTTTTATIATIGAPHYKNKNKCNYRFALSTMGTDAADDKVKAIAIDPRDARGVIFDIDGTLADSWKLGFDATQVVLTNNNISPITEELYHDCTRYCTPDRLARHAGLLPNDENGNGKETFQSVGNRLAAEFDDLYVGLVSLETAGFYDGIQDLLFALPQEPKEESTSNEDEQIIGATKEEEKEKEKKYVKVAALTNACVAYAHAVLKTNCPILGNSRSNDDDDDDRKGGIYDRFESIHGADTVPKPKPDPSGLLQCCNEIDIDPKECVYIGDSPSDAVAAKNAGFGAAIGVSWGSHPLESVQQAPFDYICETVDELRDLLIN
mmetsp:Transcript_15555/g.23390  ORF Transcript_15555/g.23390 Transcript_15555/m.23390 type:complete len:363 (-) Transcript_15555:547-1635(-)